MDDTLQELENELKRLTPRRPSPRLLRTLEHELAEESPTPTPQAEQAPRGWQRLTWSLAAVAAMVAVMIVLKYKPSSDPAISPAVAAVAQPVPLQVGPSAANQYQPVKATSVLYDLKEEGAAILSDQTEGRQVRYRYVDTYTWKNPTTKASLRWSVPRDEVRVVRASLD